METEAGLAISEKVESSLTAEQVNRLEYIDWFIDEFEVTMEETKEYGVLQAQWRHNDRVNIFLLEGKR